MTYNQIRYVPDSRHIFYKYAFQTLYTLHDASKQGFQRARFVEMSESEFINVFSLFCLVSYADGEHSFSHDEMLNYFEKIKVRAIAKFDSQKFIQECTESVNLIYKEGNQYTFIHRSFQEYFCAYAATHYFPDSLGEVVLSLPANRTDAVFGMMYQMSPEIVSRMFIRPLYERFKTKINDTSKIVNTMDFLKALSVHVEILFDANAKSGRFGYGWQFQDDVIKFSEALACMFKDELPLSRVAEHAGFGSLNSAIKFLREIAQIKPSRDNELAYLALIDFDTGSLEISVENPQIEKFGDVVYSANLENLAEFASVRYFEEVAQALKAELVFAKKKSDEVTRKIRDISKRSEGILSL